MQFSDKEFFYPDFITGSWIFHFLFAFLFTYLAATWATLGHYPVDFPAYPMLITEFNTYFIW